MCSQGETQHSTQSVRILSLCGDIKVVITNPIFEGIDVKHNQILSFKTFTLQSWDELRYIRSHQANFTDGTNMRPEANFNSKFPLLHLPRHPMIGLRRQSNKLLLVRHSFSGHNRACILEP